MIWLMISSGIFMDPLLAHKSPAHRLKTNSLWDGLYSTTIHRLRVPSASLYTQIWSAFRGFRFELESCPLLEIRRFYRLYWTSSLVSLRVLAWFSKMMPSPRLNAWRASSISWRWEIILVVGRLIAKRWYISKSFSLASGRSQRSCPSSLRY